MKEKNKPLNYRQGEVLIMGITKKPKTNWVDSDGFKPKSDNCIAEGEISGHKHEVTNGKLYEKNGKMVLEAQDGCSVTHPEHKPINVPKGIYEMLIQREYKDGEARKVKD